MSCGCFLGFLGTVTPMRNGEAIDLVELIQKFGDEQQCRNYLEALRWHDGVRCPKCGGSKISSILKRDQYNCDNEDCRYQFSVTAGTIFHDTHLPLCKWFLAAYLLCQSRKGMSANQIKRMLGISYKTAWYLCHRIRKAMEAADGERLPLGGTVEFDETFVGARQRGHQWKVGNPKCKKQVVIGIRQRGGELRFFHAQDVKKGTLAKYIKENISQDVDVIMTDEFPGYPKALQTAGVVAEHKTVCHQDGEYVRGDVYTNTVESAFSLLKCGIVGTWHRVSAKHLQAYLNEMCFRFDNRKNPYLFRDTLKRMLASDNLEFKELTAA
jgi:transposase-like protein